MCQHTHGSSTCSLPAMYAGETSCRTERRRAPNTAHSVARSARAPRTAARTQHRYGCGSCRAVSAPRQDVPCGAPIRRLCGSAYKVSRGYQGRWRLRNAQITDTGACDEPGGFELRGIAGMCTHLAPAPRPAAVASLGRDTQYARRAKTGFSHRAVYFAMRCRTRGYKNCAWICALRAARLSVHTCYMPLQCAFGSPQVGTVYCNNRDQTDPIGTGSARIPCRNERTSSVHAGCVPRLGKPKSSIFDPGALGLGKPRHSVYTSSYSHYTTSRGYYQ
jgi:hypothetical protein